MDLDNAQLVTLGNDIRANGNLTSELAAGDHQAIADWYNQEAAPAVSVFKSNLPRTAISGSMDWVNEYDPGFKDDIEAIGFLVEPTVGYDPRPVENRNALNAVFSGAPNTKANILGVAVRNCSYGEKLYIEATTGPGGGDGSSAGSSAIATEEGDVIVQNVRDALALT